MVRAFMSDATKKGLPEPGEHPAGDRCRIVPLYSGIELCDLTLAPDPFPAHPEPQEHILQISYCRSGQMAWRMENGDHIYLNPGDFALQRMEACAHSRLSFPTGQYAGFAIRVDLRETAAHPPEPFQGATDFFGTLAGKFCRDKTVAFFVGNEDTARIFSAFYDQPEQLALPYQRVKALELFLYLAKMEYTKEKQLTAYQSEQLEIIRRIHDSLLGKLDQRITIEELSREYLINPTTLKTAFKAVYGTSLAAHIKTHRMEQAARLLRETDKSIAEIAQAVGYDSQSRFTTAFKSVFQLLPKEYRKTV